MAIYLLAIYLIYKKIESTNPLRKELLQKIFRMYVDDKKKNVSLLFKIDFNLAMELLAVEHAVDPAIIFVLPNVTSDITRVCLF